MFVLYVAPAETGLSWANVLILTLLDKIHFNFHYLNQIFGI